MRPVLWLRASVVFFAFALGGAAEPSATSKPIATPRSASAKPAAQAETKSAPHEQLLVVRTATWNAATGTLQRFERGRAQTWAPVGAPISVNVGRRGLGWGRGLHVLAEGSPKEEPVKREGDGKSPAGLFALGTAFGAALELPAEAHAFPYLQAGNSSYCVEDERSQHYNRIIDAREIEATTWERWSPLKRSDGLFRWGVVVRHNDEPPRVGAGSCVFLHIWRGPGQGTAGCTAMAATDVELALTWLDPEAHPRLAQLPEAAYLSHRAAWDLPE